MNKLLCSMLILLFITPVYAQVTGFVDSHNPDNSTAWRDAVTRLGAAINTNVNFDTHPLGTLDGGFYSVSDGITMRITGDITNVTYGEGPGQGNVTSTPLSTGEGKHKTSNYLADGSAESALTISFDQPVYGAGIFVIDNFNVLRHESISICINYFKIR